MPYIRSGYAITKLLQRPRQKCNTILNSNDFKIIASKIDLPSGFQQNVFPWASKIKYLDKVTKKVKPKEIVDLTASTRSGDNPYKTL